MDVKGAINVNKEPLYLSAYYLVLSTEILHTITIFNQVCLSLVSCYLMVNYKATQYVVECEKQSKLSETQNHCNSA